MLFNSLPFILFFLPITILFFWFFSRRNSVAGRVVLALASFAFYAYWDWRFLPLLIGSIVVNYSFGMVIAHQVSAGSKNVKAFFIGGVSFNLFLLCVFKYANLLEQTSHEFLGTPMVLPAFILPIGISFFTFTQIAFLVDAYKEGVREYRFWDYALFVSYFPHQIAGPILHHKEMMSQFRDSLLAKVNMTNLAVGSSIFILGLAKKVLLADTFETFASPVFDAAEKGVVLMFVEAWVAALAYTLQLYFDFSAYCDMAIGISLFFGIRLPANFDSPYKATNIIEFWRRWHMTLSRFLKDYLYIPLGGNRNGKVRRYFNLLITMGLGGLWHGASWTFLFWGLLHGIYLTMNHAWQSFLPTTARIRGAVSYRALSWCLTFVAVMIGWVFFRAATFSGALTMLGAMFGNSGIAMPPQFIGSGHSGFIYSYGAWLGAVGGGRALILCGLGLVLVLFTPNLQQIFALQSPVLDKSSSSGKTRLVWRLGSIWAVLLGMLGGLSISRLGNESAFLYFNF